MGHNAYGEIAWPNDLLYMFPVCILGVLGIALGLATCLPVACGEPSDPFATPLEILPEWFLLPTFQILRAIPNKVLGVFLMTSVPLGLITIPAIESITPFCNPLRRPLSSVLFVLGLFLAIFLGFGSLLPLLG